MGQYVKCKRQKFNKSKLGFISASNCLNYWHSLLYMLLVWCSLHIGFYYFVTIYPVITAHFYILSLITFNWFITAQIDYH